MGVASENSSVLFECQEKAFTIDSQMWRTSKGGMEYTVAQDGHVVAGYEHKYSVNGKDLLVHVSELEDSQQLACRMYFTNSPTAKNIRADLTVLGTYVGITIHRILQRQLPMWMEMKESALMFFLIVFL